MRSTALTNLTRRDLLRAGVVLGGTAGVASALGVPGIMEKAVYAAGVENVKADVTIGLIQLAGGHDGLGTVIPLADALDGMRPGYGERVIQGAMDAGTRLNADFAPHPSLKAIPRRFLQGHVAIVMDVGSPSSSGPNVWSTRAGQTADPTSRQLTGAFGRLAQYLDPKGHPLGLSSLGAPTVPGILRGQGPVAVLPAGPTFAFKGAATDQAVAALWKAGVPGVFGQALTDAMATARATAAQLKPLTAAYKSQAAYDAAATTPAFQAKTELGRDLQVAAALIKGGAAPTVFHAAMPGWDLHQGQEARQADLLRQLDQAVDGFLTDCATAGRFPTIVTLFQFGRTVGIHSSARSDHGSATPMLVIGETVTGGIYGAKPNLTGYDVPPQVDFRSVYATLIQHLGVDPKLLVGGFAPVPFLRP